MNQLSLLFLRANTAFMKSLLFVFIGGGTGSVLRYLLSSGINRLTAMAFPWGTFTVNLVGCVLIGIAYSLSERWSWSAEIRLLLTVGLCGGFTTFSTFSNESLQLLRAELYLPFFLYVLGSVLGGLGGVFLGAALCK